MIYLWFQVDKLLKEKNDHIERLRASVDRERIRAEKAIDELLRKSNCMPVSQESKRRTISDADLRRNLNSVARVGMDIEGTDGN